MTTRNWQNITDYMDTVGTTLKTFTFNKTQNFVQVTIRGNANVTYTIGSQSGTLSPGQSISVSEKITSFTLTAVSGTQTVEVWATEDGTQKVEDDSKDPISLATTIQQSSLQKIMIDLYNRLAVTIDCQGDSTYYGSSLQTITTTAPQQMLSILNRYYNNYNITVTNNGIPGNQTTNRLRTWDADMQASLAQVVFMNYGINDATGGNPTGVTDPAISAEQYRLNLRQMISIARKRGKIVVLETPNPVVQYNKGNQDSSEKVKQFASVMRQVAKEMECPLVDNHYWVEKYLSTGLNILNELTDGIHPGQNLYLAKGQNMAGVFIEPNSIELSGASIIPATSPSIIATGGSNSATVTSASLTGYGRFANYMRIPIWVKETGVDIYIATTVWSGATYTAKVVINGAQVGSTFNPIDTNLTGGTAFAVDHEVMVIENAKPGFYLIEYADNSGQGTYDVGLYYVRSYKTRAKSLQYGGSATSTTRNLVLSDFDITAGSNNATNHVLTDIPVSRFLKTVDIEVDATLAKNDGIVLFHHRMGLNSGNPPMGGILVYLDNTTGYISIAEGSSSSYINNTALGSVDLSGASHRYRITVTTAGVVTVYVDGNQIGTYTQTKLAHMGGFLGFYKGNAGTTRIDRVTIN